MKKICFLFLLVNPMLSHAQSDTMQKGVEFEEGLTWAQVKAKALSENKCIFVDCFATWCGPCKRMDIDIYRNDRVGDYMNSKFISVKVQMDSTGEDEDEVKQWYPQAQQLRKEYKVVDLPTFLFFSPDGKILHKGFGYNSIDDFMILLRTALTPDKQYYTLLRSFKNRQLLYADMPYLAETAKELHEYETADLVAQYYSENCLLKLKDEDLYTKENIAFLKSFLQRSSDRGFELFYQHPAKIDGLMEKKGYAGTIVDYIITKEEIYPWLVKDGKPVHGSPDWIQMVTRIRTKFGESYAERTVLNAKIRWYTYKKDWEEAVKYNVLKIDRYGLDTVGFGKYSLSDMIYSTIFMHSIDKKTINKAIIWMQMLLKIMPDDAACIDTYANLLYKSGKTDEALKWENKAVRLNPTDSSIRENFLKIQRGAPTWAIN